MTGTELETAQGSSLVLDSQQTFWNDQQVAALQQLGVDRASQGDLQVYHHVCQRTGLDPFARQIYMIERQGKQTIQTGIDGYRLVARRAVDASREPLSIASAQWCGPDAQWTDVWLAEGPPAAARVVVKRGSGEFTAVALWREYVQTAKDRQGQEYVTKMWRTRPAGQLAKCAEALALRKAFPQDLSGIYVDAELDRANVVQGEVVQQGGLGAALAAQNSGAEDAPDDPSPQSAEPDSAPDPITSGQLTKIGILCGELGLTDAAEARRKVGALVGRDIKSRKELTKSEAHHVIEQFAALVEQPFPPGGEQEPVDAEVVES